MFIEKLEVQGFKTFAKKSVLTFPKPKKDFSPTTVIVGPNGSGKSNLADAVRWVLGEQSLKLLRGKKSEDVIFSGAAGKARSGFAEVTITLNNEDGAMPIEYSQVVITRRLYRDGESEYLLNDTKARLSDIQLLLAQANVGQRSYSVIGQGMVDHILISSPEERKAFFDDATGVKQFQLKRHEAMLKLKRTYENLSEVEMLLREIEPRLRSLKRQVSRLEKRDAVEQALREMESEYYGTLWWQLTDQLDDVRGRHKKVNKEAEEVSGELKKMESKVESYEKQQVGGDDEEMIALQKKYRDKQRDKAKLRDQYFEAQKQIELNKVRAQSNWAPLPLNKIIEELGDVTKEIKALEGLEVLEVLKERIDRIWKRSEKLLGRLQRPAPEDIKPDPKLVSRVKELEGQIRRIDEELSAIDKQMTESAAKEKETRTELFDIQRELRDKQSQLHLLENRRNELAIELARLEERQQNLDREIKEQMKDKAPSVQKERVKKAADTDALYPEIQRLRYKLELIGGIDPEIVQEYEETAERHEFLDTQVKDLQQAIKSTEKIIDELDEKIQKQSEKAFKDINKEFQRFFKILFGGGTCSLVKMAKDEVDEDVGTLQATSGGVTPDRVGDDTAEEAREEHEEDTSIEAIKKRVKEREDRVVGIDIQATPPGKKMKALNLLSGGERAMTSIALISAIMAVNPSPFVLLDEVDAALDEANTYRFAQIIKELAKLSQFIIVTHNRATMESADMLYGVTISEDGISNLLAVKLEEIE